MSYFEFADANCLQACAVQEYMEHCLNCRDHGMKDRLNAARLGTNMGYFRSRVRELLENKSFQPKNPGTAQQIIDELDAVQLWWSLTEM